MEDTQTIQSKTTIDGGTVYWIGSYDNTEVILIIGRTNFAKSDPFMEPLTNTLRRTNYTLMWYEDIGISLRRKLSLKEMRPIRWRWMRRVVKAAILLRHPHCWRYFWPGYIEKTSQIPFRCEKLREFIRSLGSEKNIVVISRSAGGIISSRIDDEPSIKKLICLGYPFKNPDKPEESERIEHLTHIKKPFFIIQGLHDIYGGKEVAIRYAQSPQISLSFVNSDHDLALSVPEGQQAIDQILSFIES